jgi:hypothetical protein
MPWILENAEKFVKELHNFDEYPNNLIRQNYTEISKIHEQKISQYNQRKQERVEAARLQEEQRLANKEAKKRAKEAARIA